MDAIREWNRRRIAGRLSKEGTDEEKYRFLRESMTVGEIADEEVRYLRMIDLCAKYKLNLPISN